MEVLFCTKFKTKKDLQGIFLTLGVIGKVNKDCFYSILFIKVFSVFSLTLNQSISFPLEIKLWLYKSDPNQTLFNFRHVLKFVKTVIRNAEKVLRKKEIDRVL